MEYYSVIKKGWIIDTCYNMDCCWCSVTKSCLILWPHGLQTPSLLSPRICSNSGLLSQWCYPTISSSVAPSPPALYLSQHRVFSNELAVDIRWPKYWSLSISPSSEYSGLIFFRINWFDLLAIQQTLENLLQHYNLKSSILQHSANSHIHTWLLEKP